MSEDEKSFGEYLKELREAQGYTLIELGEAIGYSDAYLSQIEKGRKKNPPTIHLLKELSYELNEPYSNLLKMAEYDELSAGQKLLEMLDAQSVGLNEKATPRYTLDDEINKKIQLSREIIDSYIRVINMYELEIKVSNEMVDYLNRVLVRNREYMAVFLESSIKWGQLKTKHSQLTSDEEALRRAYLDMSTKLEKRRLFDLIEDGF